MCSTRPPRTRATLPSPGWPSRGGSVDQVRDYLRLIARVRLLSAEQEVDLAKRIEAGLYAEHKLLEEPPRGPRPPTGVGDPHRGRGNGPSPTSSRPTCVWSCPIGEALHGPRAAVPGPGPGRAATGLIRAVEKFDCAEGLEFSTYADLVDPAGDLAARWRTRAWTHPHPRASGRGHLPGGPHPPRARSRTSGRQPTPEELAEKAGVPVVAAGLNSPPTPGNPYSAPHRSRRGRRRRARRPDRGPGAASPRWTWSPSCCSRRPSGPFSRR